MCNNWPDFPIAVEGVTGGLIGNTVMICGGYGVDYFDECYSLTSEKATQVIHMSIGRLSAASIVLNDNTLWVTGGYHDDLLASTEYVRVTGTMPGPNLPMALSNHAMVAINSTCSMVIGGLDESWASSASTLYYNYNTEQWINGPSLIQARRIHAAGIVTDEVTDENFVVVTGGHANGYLDSTEILQDGNWVQGNISTDTCFVLNGLISVAQNIPYIPYAVFWKFSGCK